LSGAVGIGVEVHVVVGDTGAANGHRLADPLDLADHLHVAGAVSVGGELVESAGGMLQDE